MSTPLWSPSGNYIAVRYFVKSDSVESCASCTHNAGGTTGLAVISADGIDFDLLDRHIYLVSWLPDGDRLAYAAPPPGESHPRELIVFIKDFQAGTTQEITRIDESARILTWNVDGGGFYTSRYNWTLHKPQLLYVDLQASTEPFVLQNFDDDILDVSPDGRFVLLERQITPWEAGPHYVQQLIKYDLTTQNETVLVTAWDFILGRLVDDARHLLVQHPTTSLDVSPESYLDWNIRHRLIDLDDGTSIFLPDLPGIDNTIFQLDIIVTRNLP